MTAADDGRPGHHPETRAESTTSERAPLLGNKPRDHSPVQQGDAGKWSASVVLKLLFTSTIVSLSFGVTQVP